MEASADCTDLTYLESGEEAYSWSRRSSRAWGSLVFYGGGVHGVQVGMYYGARWGRFGRVGGVLVVLGFLRTRGHVMAEIVGPEK